MVVAGSEGEVMLVSIKCFYLAFSCHTVTGCFLEHRASTRKKTTKGTACRQVSRLFRSVFAEVRTRVSLSCFIATVHLFFDASLEVCLTRRQSTIKGCLVRLVLDRSASFV